MPKAWKRGPTIQQPRHDHSGTLHAFEAFDALSLDDLEEASGELHRRCGGALRRIGEAHADRDDLGAAAMSPRWTIAGLAAGIELAAGTFGAIAAGGSPILVRSDQHPVTVAAIMYATPSIQGLLGRLEQDRRLLASYARHLDDRLAETHRTAWGEHSLRRLLTEIAIVEPARSAQALEQQAAAVEAEARLEIEEDT